MAFMQRAPGIPVHRFFLCVLGGVFVSVPVAATEATAARPPRAERIVTRRLERIEVLERKAEAAAEMPPRPVDVRRLLRRGVPLSEIMPQGGSRSAAAAASAAARRPVAPATRAPVAAAARPPAATPPQSFTPAPDTTAARPPAVEPPLRFPEQPAGGSAGSASAVAPATAIDDGTRSVLVREEPTPAAPAELLPTPQPQ